MAKVAVAVSGGGHRAAAFGLGALLYLVDSGVSSDVTSIASVSGGSITNAYVAQQIDFAAATPSDLRGAARELARRLGTTGTLFACWTTKAYVASLAVGLAAVAAGGALAPGLDKLWVIAGGIVAWSYLATLRSRVCAHAFERTLFRSAQGPTPLTALHRSVDHVLCATDLRSANFVYFSGGFVASYPLGLGCPGDLALADAVQASACLPGAFVPRRFRSSRFGLPDRVAIDGTERRTRHLVVVDGGVYDNMADEWAKGYEDRSARWPQAIDPARRPDELVVVNASAKMPWTPYRRGRWPLAGELFALLRDKDILYNATTAPRRYDLVQMFEAAEQSGRGMRGALVHIAQSPYGVAEHYQAERDGAGQPTPRARRAAIVVERLRGDAAPDAWAHVAREDAKVPTVLSKLGAEVTARLIRHAYVLAMCNLHVLLDYPLGEIPPDGQFLELCR